MPANKVKRDADMKTILYGDGVHDDYPAIQELLDSGSCCVALPAPKEHYIIGKTLKIHSNQELRLDRFALIRLADHANCSMLENASPKSYDKNISVSGGIWDMNHRHQWANPYHFPMPNGLTAEQEQEKAGFCKNGRLFFEGYSGMCFRFNSIRTFVFRDVTIRNPVVYGIQMAYVEDFTVENLCFDYTEGSPKLWNMDGVHCEGGCRNGVIRNLKGACHDDLVAITSDDGIYGPIDNITVNGIYAYGCHSAVRLLSVRTPISNIRISDVFGSFYVYAVMMSQYYQAKDARGIMRNIRIENLCASICEGTKDVPGNYESLIAIKSGLDIDGLIVDGLYRDESRCPLPSIEIESGAKITQLCIRHVHQRNSTGTGFPVLRNAGQIEGFCLSDISSGGDAVLKNTGEIAELKEADGQAERDCP